MFPTGAALGPSPFFVGGGGRRASRTGPRRLGPRALAEHLASPQPELSSGRTTRLERDGSRRLAIEPGDRRPRGAIPGGTRRPQPRVLSRRRLGRTGFERAGGCCNARLPDRRRLRCSYAPGGRRFAPMPLERLPFRNIVGAQQRRPPYVDPERARYFAQRWGAPLIDAEPQGHINTGSGIGEWPEAEHYLAEFLGGHVRTVCAGFV